MNKSIEHAQGCLLGALAGDAAGARLEFLGRAPKETELADALAMKGGGVLRVAPGQVTDDGEMTLALARALEGAPRYPLERVARSYRAWVTSGPFDIGNATYAALGLPGLAEGGFADAISRSAATHNMASKANGALMRASALGIWATRLSRTEASQAAREDASLTHPNSSCQWANAAYVVAIRHLLLHPGDGTGAVDEGREALRAAHEGSEEVQTWLDEAERGALPAAHPSAGFVRIAFCHAFHHLMRGSSYQQAIQQVLSRGGDTDTNACIVGGLVGARVGIGGIPPEMVRAVVECETSLGRSRPDWLSTKDAMEVARGLMSPVLLGGR